MYLVRKKGGRDDGQLYAMKAIKISTVAKTVKMAKTERQVRIQTGLQKTRTMPLTSVLDLLLNSVTSNRYSKQQGRCRFW